MAAGTAGQRGQQLVLGALHMVGALVCHDRRDHLAQQCAHIGLAQQCRHAAHGQWLGLLGQDDVITGFHDGFTHAIESNRHEIEFDELRMLISHVIDSDTGNSIILMIDVLIVMIKELVDKGIRLSDLLEYHIDKLLVFGDFEKECHPD